MLRLLIGVINSEFLWHYWQIHEAEFSLNAFKYDADTVQQMQFVDLFLSVMINSTEKYL